MSVRSASELECKWLLSIDISHSQQTVFLRIMWSRIYVLQTDSMHTYCMPDVCVLQAGRQTGRHADRQAGRQTDRQTASVLTVVWYLCVTDLLTLQLKITVAYACISLGTGRTKHIVE